MADRRKVALQLRKQLSFCSALKNLAQKTTSWTQNVRSKLGCGLGKRHYSQVISIGMSGCRLGHIRKDDVGGATITQQRFKLVWCAVVHEVQMDDFSAGHRFHFGNVERDDLTTTGDCLGSFNRDLRPSSGSSAEVNNHLTWFQDVVLIVDFNQLERCARAITGALCGGNIRVV